MYDFGIWVQAKDSDGSPLKLTLKSSGTAPDITYAVGVANPSLTENQVWTPIAFMHNGNDLGFILLNQPTNMVVVAPADDQAVIVQPYAELKTTDRAFWRFIGSGDYGAIQLQANTDMNLNVFGDNSWSSTSTVGVWGWGHSQPNEMWAFLNLDLPVSSS